MASGSLTTADHFPGNQEKGGAAPVKELLQEAGQQTKEPILSPHIRTKRRCLPSPGSGQTLGEFGKSFLLSLHFPICKMQKLKRMIFKFRSNNVTYCQKEILLKVKKYIINNYTKMTMANRTVSGNLDMWRFY